MCRITGPVNFNLLCGLTVDMHGGAAFLLILLDVIAELGVHKRLITGKAAFFQVLCPEEFFVHPMVEKFLADMGIIRHPL